MIKSRVFWILVVSLLIIPSKVQAGWTRIYGGEEEDIGRSVRQASDGGYIIAGATASYGNRFGSLWLLKTDSLGDTLWAHTYGRYEGSIVNLGICVQETSDKGLIITGMTAKGNIVITLESTAIREAVFVDVGIERMDLWLVRMDSLGNPLWEGTHGRKGIASGEFVSETSDGGYIVAGHHIPYDEEWPAIFLIKMDENGNTQWKETYSSPVPSFGHCTQETSDGNYITCGIMGNDLCLIKSDSTGQIVWTQLYGGRKMDVARYLEETTDSGFIVVGETYSFGRGKSDIWLLKTDDSGDTLWTKTYGWRRDEEALSLDLTKDGGYIITGYKKHRAEDIWILKTDVEGDTL